MVVWDFCIFWILRMVQKSACKAEGAFIYFFGLLPNDKPADVLLSYMADTSRCGSKAFISLVGSQSWMQETCWCKRNSWLRNVERHHVTLLSFLRQYGNIEKNLQCDCKLSCKWVNITVQRSQVAVSRQTNNTDRFWRSCSKYRRLKTTHADGPYLILNNRKTKQQRSVYCKTVSSLSLLLMRAMISAEIRMTLILATERRATDYWKCQMEILYDG